jgi:hypothetical protein
MKTRPQIGQAKVQARTRVGTGSAMLAGVDGRSHGGRRYREVCADLVQHLGGDATAPQEAIIRRAAALIIWLEAQETAQATTGDLDIASYSSATNVLRRLLSDLGLQRKTRDVTPSLSDYITQKGRADD